MRIYSIKGKKGTKWGVDFKDTKTGKRICEIIGSNKKQAENVLAKIQSEIVDKGYFEKKTQKKKLFVDVMNEYIEYAKQNKKTFQEDISILDRFIKFQSKSTNNRPIKELLLSEITTKIIEDFKNMKITQVEPATVNRNLATIKRLFSLAVDWDYSDINPVKKIKFFKEPPGRTRFLLQAEIDALLKACDEVNLKARNRSKHLKMMIIIALNTGMRKGELLNLKWDDIDFSNKMIKIRTSKNGEERNISMNEDVKKVIDELSSLRKKKNVLYIDDFVFSKGGKPFLCIKNAFQSALEIAKISNFHWHDLRHTCASHMAMKGIDLNTIRETLGHKSMAMTLRYSHLTNEHRKKALEGLYEKKDARNLQEKDNLENSQNLNASEVII